MRLSGAASAGQYMGYSVRFYLFTAEGAFRVAHRVVEGLVRGTDAIPKYAGTTQKAATIRIEGDDEGVARVVEAVGEFWRFDEVGKIHRSLREAGWRALESFPAPATSGDDGVVDISPKLNRKKWERENRWELTKGDLDLIASDLQIDGFRKNGPRLRAVSGSAPRREPLTYEAKSAIREIESATYQIFGQLERLTESALKGLTFEAKTRAEDDPLWTGIAAAAERRREILRRHRTGKGVWYAVIEGLRSEPGSNRGEIFTLAYEKCDSLKAAEAAARCLLIKNAEHFSQLIGIEPHVYSELEWSPP
jgi:hypothetical protein